jgi:uncharacterized membrane protein
MAVLFILFISWILLRTVGAFGVVELATWRHSLPYALAIMFVFTGIAHFNRLRHDLVRMIPSIFPRPMLTVYLTGIFELLGAAGLLIPKFREPAGICLIVLLLAMLPANVSAAQRNITLNAKPVTKLSFRIPMQILLIALIAWASLR